MDALQRFKTRHGISQVTSGIAPVGNSVNVQDRMNFVTLANAVELIALAASGVLNDSKGISTKIGDDRITRQDIADATVSELMGTIAYIEESKQ